jgi:hypothetical protein
LHLYKSILKIVTLLPHFTVASIHGFVSESRSNLPMDQPLIADIIAAFEVEKQRTAKRMSLEAERELYQNLRNEEKRIEYFERLGGGTEDWERQRAQVRARNTKLLAQLESDALARDPAEMRQHAGFRQAARPDVGEGNLLLEPVYSATHVISGTHTQQPTVVGDSLPVVLDSRCWRAAAKSDDGQGYRAVDASWIFTFNTPPQTSIFSVIPFVSLSEGNCGCILRTTGGRSGSATPLQPLSTC